MKKDDMNMMYVGEAFLKKGLPPHPLSKTFREEYG